jgi:hypothetical protein
VRGCACLLLVLRARAALSPPKHRLRPAGLRVVATDDELRQMRGWAVGGMLVMTIVGDMSDGAIALIDLSSSPAGSVRSLGVQRGINAL